MIEQAVVSLTPDAQSRLKELLEKEGNPQLALRIFGVQIIVDDFSAPYIRGSEIDYVDSLMGAGFTVHNPNAVHSCSCGHSFDTGDDASSAQSCGCGH